MHGVPTGLTARTDAVRGGTHVSVVRAAIPQGIDGESQRLGPVAVRSGREKVALFSKVLIVMGMVGRCIAMMRRGLWRLSRTCRSVGSVLPGSMGGTGVPWMTLEFGRSAARHVLVLRSIQHSFTIGRTGHRRRHTVVVILRVEIPDGRKVGMRIHTARHTRDDALIARTGYVRRYRSRTVVQEHGLVG